MIGKMFKRLMDGRAGCDLLRKMALLNGTTGCDRHPHSAPEPEMRARTSLMAWKFQHCLSGRYAGVGGWWCGSGHSRRSAGSAAQRLLGQPDQLIGGYR